MSFFLLFFFFFFVLLFLFFFFFFLYFFILFFFFFFNDTATTEIYTLSLHDALPISGNFGFKNPADYPYEVVSLTLSQGLDSLGEKKEKARSKVRPWIQVFDLGAKYTPAMIEAQIKATYDVLGKENTGWLMWSPRNDYDRVLNIEL